MSQANYTSPFNGTRTSSGDYTWKFADGSTSNERWKRDANGYFLVGEEGEFVGRKQADGSILAGTGDSSGAVFGGTAAAPPPTPDPAPSAGGAVFGGAAAPAPALPSAAPPPPASGLLGQAHSAVTAPVPAPAPAAPALPPGANVGSDGTIWYPSRPGPVSAPPPPAAPPSAQAPSPAPSPAQNAPANAFQKRSDAEQKALAQSIKNYQPDLDRKVDARSMTIEGRINGLLGRDQAGNYTNPVVQQAAMAARKSFAGRGLLNSSMSEQAALEAATGKAIEIAGPDAQTYFSQGRANQDATNTFARDKSQSLLELQKMATANGYDLSRLDKLQGFDMAKMSQGQLNDLEKMAKANGYDLVKMDKIQGFDLEKMSTANGYDMSKMSQAQINDLVKMDKINQQDLQKMATANGYELVKMDKANGYDLNRLDKISQIDLEKMATANGYELVKMDKANGYDQTKLDKNLALEREKLTQNGSQFNLDLAYRYESLNLGEKSRTDAQALGHKYALEINGIQAVDSAFDLYTRRLADIDNNKELDEASKVSMKNAAGKNFDLYAKAKGVVYQQEFGNRFSVAAPAPAPSAGTGTGTAPKTRGGTIATGQSESGG